MYCDRQGDMTRITQLLRDIQPVGAREPFHLHFWPAEKPQLQQLLQFSLSCWHNTEFDMDDLDFDQEYEDNDEMVSGGGGEPSEAEYERVLLANLSPSESEDEGEEIPRAKRKKRGGKQST